MSIVVLRLVSAQPFEMRRRLGDVDSEHRQQV